jgi:hypothetical protein
MLCVCDQAKAGVLKDGKKCEWRHLLNILFYTITKYSGLLKCGTSDKEL